MNTAKAFGAVLTAVLVFVGQEFDPQPAPWAVWQAVAITSFAVSIVLYLVALFFYDSLLLPRRYWGAKLPRRTRRRALQLLLRPPSSAAWVLFQNMLRVWHRLFVPATFAAGIAVAATIVALVQPQGPYAWGGAIAAAAVAVAVAWWAWLSHPVLGARD